MTTVTIAGGGGFIGRHLAAKLARNNFKVKILTRQKGRKCGKDKFPVCAVNYQDTAALSAALKDTDYLINLTGCLFGFTEKEYFEGNVLPTRTLIQAANATPTLKKFIQISSQAAAGPAPSAQPLDEQQPCNPVADYGRTKLAAEKEFSNLKKPFVILRPPIVYGPNASGLSDLLPILKFGFFIDPTPKTLYSVIHIEDLTDAVLIALKKEDLINQTFFVADPNPYTWKQILQATAGRKIHCIKTPRFLAAGAIGIYQFFAKPLKGPALLNYDKINEMNIKGHWLCSSKKWTQITGQKFRPLPNISSKS